VTGAIRQSAFKSCDQRSHFSKYSSWRRPCRAFIHIISTFPQLWSMSYL